VEGTGLVASFLQGERYGDETLLGAIVEVTLDSAPLRFGRLDQAST
jgi:hypothetical protein